MSEELAASVDEAMAPTVGRHEAEQLRVANDATLARLGRLGFAIAPHEVTNLHLAVLLDTLLGDMDDPRRQAYEVAVHTRMRDLLAETERQIMMRKLVEGIPGVDPKKLHRG